MRSDHLRANSIAAHLLADGVPSVFRYSRTRELVHFYPYTSPAAPLPYRGAAGDFQPGEELFNVTEGGVDGAAFGVERVNLINNPRYAAVAAAMRTFFASRNTCNPGHVPSLAPPSQPPALSAAPSPSQGNEPPAPTSANGGLCATGASTHAPPTCSLTAAQAGHERCKCSVELDTHPFCADSRQESTLVCL